MTNLNKIVRIISIDPGINKTGFAVLEAMGRQIRTLAYGTIEPPNKNYTPDRLKFLNSELSKILTKFKPSHMAIEDMYYGKNVKSALILGQARGVLILAAAENGIPCSEYAPRKVKQSVVGNGNADKDQVKYMVKQILKIESIKGSNDISDALAVGICHFNQNKYI